MRLALRSSDSPLARGCALALVAFALAACGSAAPGGATHVVGTSQASVTLVAASPLDYAARSCRVDGVALALHALTPAPDAALELRVLQSPTARRDERCRHRFGGDDLLHTPLAGLGIEPLGAVNGWFFSRLPDGSSRSNGFLWSQLAAGPRVLAPLASTEDPDMHGDRLVVADARGLHELRLASGPCAQGECRARVLASVSDPAVAAHAAELAVPLDDAALAALVTELFPTATMAMQLVAALPDAPVTAETPAQERVAAAWRCPTDHSAPDGWKCERQAVSVLCGAVDGRVSLLSVEPARYWEIVAGLRAGGPCATECAQLYVLDGGYSPQLATHDADGWDMRWGFFEESAPAEGCPQYRPVEHWLVLGRR
jgi:hypothetical protein